MRPRLAATVLIAAAACPSCKSAGGHPLPRPGVTPSSLTVTSRSFAAGGTMPVDLTCDGAGKSPQLTWSAPPQGTRTLALIAYDPDAPGGDFTHWVVFNLPGETLALPEAADVSQLGAAVGLNGFDKAEYAGPCPPKLEIHHYVFRLYALDAKLDVAPGASREAVESAMNGHLLAEGFLAGEFAH